VPRIDNSQDIPQVAPGYHTLRILAADLVEDHAYQQPDVPETRLEMTLQVRTPGQPQNTFKNRMSLNLGEKSTLGSVARAALGVRKIGPEGINTEDLIGKDFGSMVNHSEAGWPRLVSGAAGPVMGTNPVTTVMGSQIPNEYADIEQVPWDSGEEPPF
jgi:hypothetical protein